VTLLLYHNNATMSDLSLSHTLAQPSDYPRMRFSSSKIPLDPPLAQRAHILVLLHICQ
jgi:hypothetical protein